MFTKKLDLSGVCASKSCHMDGRYWNAVLSDYPGLVKEPMYIIIKERKSKKTGLMEEKIHFRWFNLESADKSAPLIARLIIQTPTARHCNLLIFTPEKIYRMEPLRDQYTEKIDQLIENFFPEHDVETIEFALDEKNEKCEESGYCTAYCLMYALAYLNGEDFIPADVRKFVRKVEDTYPLPEGEPEIEYGRYSRGYHNHYGHGRRNYYGSPYIGGFPIYGGYGGLGYGGLGYGGLGYGGLGYGGYGYGYPGYGVSAPVAAGALVGGLLGGAIANS